MFRLTRGPSAISLLLFLVAAVVGYGTAGKVIAYHPFPTHPRHVYSIHSLPPSPTEEWCANTTRSQMGISQAYTIVENTLVNDAPNQRWHRLGSIDDGRFSYYAPFSNTQCLNLDDATLQQMEIRHHVWGPTAEQYADLAGRCGAVTSCAQPSAEQIYNSTYNHWDRKYFWIHLHYGQVTVSQENRRRTINHEEGHVLGLSDAGGSNCPGHPGCDVESIMHDPDSSTIWPTYSDRNLGAKAEANGQQ